MIRCVLSVFRKSSRLQREGKASSGKQQAGRIHYISLQRAEDFIDIIRWVAKFVGGWMKWASVGTPDVPDEVEGSSTPKRSRFKLQSREVEEEEEEEDRSVRRSSRITRYKLDSRNQSVLYDRLITKWVRLHSVQYLLVFSTTDKYTFRQSVYLNWFCPSALLKLFSKRWTTCRRWDADWGTETLKKR